MNIPINAKRLRATLPYAVSVQQRERHCVPE
jgi:hypothetical protein